MQTYSHFVLLLAGFVVVAGCGSPQTEVNETGNPDATVVVPVTPDETAEPPERSPNTPTDQLDNSSAADPGNARKLRAEKENLEIKAGETARVQLQGVKPDAEMKVAIEPDDKKMSASLEGATLVLKAQPDAQGDATVTVTSGDEKATVKVTVME